MSVKRRRAEASGQEGRGGRSQVGMRRSVAEDASHRILLGRIAGAHGLKGEVLIQSFAKVPEGIAAYGPLSDADGGKTITIMRAKLTAKGVVARLAGVGDRTAAEALTGMGSTSPVRACRQPRRRSSITPT